LINGLANIAAAPLEASPFTGIILFLERSKRKKKSKKLCERIHTGQEHTILIGYRKLENYPISYKRKGYTKTVFDKESEELNTMKAEANRWIWNSRISPSISI
jgi:hypothetical protein